MSLADLAHNEFSIILIRSFNSFHVFTLRMPISNSISVSKLCQHVWSSIDTGIAVRWSNGEISESLNGVLHKLKVHEFLGVDCSWLCSLYSNSFILYINSIDFNLSPSPLPPSLPPPRKHHKTYTWLSIYSILLYLVW